MLGYMTAKEAKSKGFTNHGSYFGIPCWIAPERGFTVCAKWSPMEHLMALLCFVEQMIRPILFPNDEPVFQFKVGPPL